MLTYEQFSHLFSSKASFLDWANQFFMAGAVGNGVDFAKAFVAADNETRGKMLFYTGAGVAAVGMTMGGKPNAGVPKDQPKLLNHFNSAESLIEGAGKLNRTKTGYQGFVRGDGVSIFKAISQNAVGRTTRGGYILRDGTTLFNHHSSKTGAFTIDINKSGKIYKIRITP